jgi:hypothetical protein
MKTVKASKAFKLFSLPKKVAGLLLLGGFLSSANAGFFFDDFDSFAGWTYRPGSPNSFTTEDSQLRLHNLPSDARVTAYKALPAPIGPSADFSITAAFNSGPDFDNRVGGFVISLLTDNDQVVASFDWHDAQAGAGFGGVDFCGQDSREIYRTDPGGTGTEYATLNGLLRLQRQGSTWTAWVDGVQKGHAATFASNYNATRLQIQTATSPGYIPPTLGLDYLRVDAVPESSTLFAGALALIPIGVSVIRRCRRGRQE